MPVSQGFCRSELAREKLIGAAFIQEARVIVEVFREQARSYSGRCKPPHTSRPASGFDKGLMQVPPQQRATGLFLEHHRGAAVGLGAAVVNLMLAIRDRRAA